MLLDYFFHIVSLVTTLARMLRRMTSLSSPYWQIVRMLVPYGVILASFAAFVVWNGGVVLGVCGQIRFEIIY